MKTREIADLLKGELHGDEDAEIRGVAAVEKAKKGEIAFIEKAESFTSTNASCLIVPKGFDHTQAETRPVGSVPATISASNPKLAFALIAEILHPPKKRSPEIHPTAVIAASAKVAKDVFIGAFTCVGEKSVIGDGTQLRAGAKIGDNVTIGRNCVLHPNVFIEDGCTIGDNVILHAGVVIGADGFGYVRRTTDFPVRRENSGTVSDSTTGFPARSDRLESLSYIKFPQIGTVVIEDDVEIGANTCVDRGALGETRIGAGTKIDNLVQVGHNVNIGRRCVIAAQTGISGSTVIEDDCVIGGQVGFGDHAHVQSGAIIGSQAGVLPGKIVRPGIWWGTPIQPLDEYKRQNAHVKGIARLKNEVKALKKQIDDLKK